MLRNILILSDVGGCVLVKSESFIPFFFKGLMINIGAVTLFADFKSRSVEEIFSSAEANPSG